MADRAPGKRGGIWTLAAIVILGLVVRAPRVTESLWYDEIAAWRDYGVRGPRWIVTSYYDPANHVAHTLLSWCSIEGLGDVLGREATLRLPALVFSILSIVAMYALGLRAGGRRLALTAATVAAIVPVSVLEGAEARGYSMMICCAAAAAATMLAALERGGAWRWIAYAGLCALGAWAHLMGVFVPLGHAAWIAWRSAVHRDRATAFRGGLAIALAGALTLALYAPIALDVLHVRRAFAGADTTGPPLLGPEGVHALLLLGGSWYWWAALPGLLLAALGLATIARRAGPARRAVALTLLGLPLMLAAVVVSGSWMYARFTFFALPGAMLLIALGLNSLWERGAWRGLAALTVLGAASALDLGLRPPKQPLREAASYVSDRRAPGDHVLVIAFRHAVLDVYAGDLDPVFSLFHGADLPERLAEADPAWIIEIYPDRVPPERHEYLRDHGYTEAHRFPGWVDWGKGDVVVWGIDNAAP